MAISFWQFVVYAGAPLDQFSVPLLEFNMYPFQMASQAGFWDETGYKSQALKCLLNCQPGFCPNWRVCHGIPEGQYPLKRGATSPGAV